MGSKACSQIENPVAPSALRQSQSLNFRLTQRQPCLSAADRPQVNGSEMGGVVFFRLSSSTKP